MGFLSSAGSARIDVSNGELEAGVDVPEVLMLSDIQTGAEWNGAPDERWYGVLLALR